MIEKQLLGVDLGATNIKAVVLDASADPSAPEVVADWAIPTRGEEGHEAVLGRLVALVEEAATRHPPIGAFGLGTPGLFDADGVVTIFTNLPGQWRGVRLRRILERALPLPLTLINDARAFTLAEGLIGAGRGANPVACLTLGTGIGGGIMIDGKLHTGATGIAGEIAHQTVLPDGRTCGCGNPGCAEAMARSDVICDMAGRATVADVFAGLRSGDAQCEAAVRTAAEYLGIAIANVFTVVGPERFVIGGGIASAGDLILDPIRDATVRRATLLDPEHIRIVPASLGPSAGAIGAALATVHHAS